MSLEPGMKIAAYEVTGHLGTGGMGEVYQARDTKLDRDVALKVLPEAFTGDPDRLARFEREAKVLASLNHPNIGSIYGLEEAEGGKFRALVLELVEGPTLADRIKQGAIPIEDALPIAKQIAEALEAAHEQGVIHRDLKPANIKVREDGTVKVLDFGLAKAFQPDASDPNMSQSPTVSLTAAATQMGMVIGTAAYMAPEQAKGRAVDVRADVWAFGAVLFEMLSGQRPFAGDDVSDTLALVLKFEPEWDRLPDEVPPRIRGLIQTCLEKSPKQRWHAIADVRLALTGAFDNAQAVLPSAGERKTPWWLRPAVVMTGALLLAGLTGLGGWSLRPTAPREVTRFAYTLPQNHQLRMTSRSVLAVSPDGRQFAYNTLDGVYLRAMGGLEATLVPGTEELFAIPRFSPDGRSVSLLRPGQTLLRLALSGGPSVVISPATAPRDVHWAADGTLFFAEAEGILHVSANGGTPKLVVSAGDSELLDTPFLLPDGDTLLFSATTVRRAASAGWDEGQIVAQSLTSGQRTLVLSGGSDARYLPSGHLVYAFEDTLFAVAFDPDRLVVESGPVSMIEELTRATQSASANYDVSDDGTLFYLAGGGVGASRLVWVDRSGDVEAVDTIPEGRYETPRLSPDGDRVLVVAEGDLRVYEIASGRESRVTTDGRTEPYADWSPSGTEVTYTSRRSGAGENIWLRRADAGEPERQLTALDGQVHVDSWAPDGRTLAAHHHGDASGSQLMLSLESADVDPERWLDREFTDVNAVFSPDGRYVAHVSDQSGQREIYIRPFPGPGGQTPVSVGGGEEPAWAANGELFYRRPSDYAMFAVPVRTAPTLEIGAPRELFRGMLSPGGSPRARYTVTADGQRFLMSGELADTGQDAGAGPRVHVVLNWVEELKARVPVN